MWGFHHPPESLSSPVCGSEGVVIQCDVAERFTIGEKDAVWVHLTPRFSRTLTKTMQGVLPPAREGRATLPPVRLALRSTTGSRRRRH